VVSERVNVNVNVSATRSHILNHWRGFRFITIKSAFKVSRMSESGTTIKRSELVRFFRSYIPLLDTDVIRLKFEENVPIPVVDECIKKLEHKLEFDTWRVCDRWCDVHWNGGVFPITPTHTLHITMKLLTSQQARETLLSHKQKLWVGRGKKRGHDDGDDGEDKQDKQDKGDSDIEDITPTKKPTTKKIKFSHNVFSQHSAVAASVTATITNVTNVTNVSKIQQAVGGMSSNVPVSASASALVAAFLPQLPKPVILKSVMSIHILEPTGVAVPGQMVTKPPTISASSFLMSQFFTNGFVVPK